MSKTAMQQLIEQLESKKSESVNPWFQSGLNNAIHQAKQLIQTEKEQIINAYHDGQITMINDFAEISGITLNIPENDKEDAQQYHKNNFEDIA